LGINVAGRMYSGGMVGSSNGSSGAGAGGTSIWMILLQALVGGEDVTGYSVIPWGLCLFAVLCSTLIGLLFGF
ncbi:ABC transporter permease, partial [Bifidobacterium breve]|nr:ABC transporter permease [Bifidobacterium breve]